MSAQAYANRIEVWENSRADQCKPETEGRGNRRKSNLKQALEKLNAAC